MGIIYGDTPLVGFRYEVNIIPEISDGDSNELINSSLISSAVSVVNKSSFSEISGVTVTLETEPVKDLNGKLTNKPKETNYSPLVLKRGLTGAQSELMAWVIASLIPEQRKKGSKNAKLIIKKTVIVNLLNDKGIPIMTWVFVGAHPTKWTMSGLKAMSNELVIEELELRYDRFYPVILGI